MSLKGKGHSRVFPRTSSENLLATYKLYLSLQNATCSFKLPVSEMSKMRNFELLHILA